MATTQTQTTMLTTTVTVSKQNLTDEAGKIVRSLYYLNIKIGDETITINTGQKTYDKIKALIK